MIPPFKSSEMSAPDSPMFLFARHMGDNGLILGHRLSEWCGHGPVLEQDIAMTNIALDLIGQARLYYQLAAEMHPSDLTEDDIAYLRPERAYSNVLLVEQPNGDFAHTVLRQFLFDAWHLPFLHRLCDSPESGLGEIAAKAVKEVSYHYRWSREWVIRLGDGTEESHRRMTQALDDLWIYREELLLPSDWEQTLIRSEIIPDPDVLRPEWQHAIHATLSEAGLPIPQTPVIQQGGKNGIHTEHLGHLLAELQYMQRAYPGQVW